MNDHEGLANKDYDPTENSDDAPSRAVPDSSYAAPTQSGPPADEMKESDDRPGAGGPPPTEPQQEAPPPLQWMVTPISWCVWAR